MFIIKNDCVYFSNVVNVVDDQMLVFDPKDDEVHFFYHGVQQKRRDLLKKPKKDLTFRFDKVFNKESTNVEVFMNSTQNLIENLMQGSNCSVFAYGATGAGKTFTMIGKRLLIFFKYFTFFLYVIRKYIKPWHYLPHNKRPLQAHRRVAGRSGF